MPADPAETCLFQILLCVAVHLRFPEINFCDPFITYLLLYIYLKFFSQINSNNFEGFPKHFYPPFPVKTFLPPKLLRCLSQSASQPVDPV